MVKVLGLCAGVAVVALGLWLVWRLGWVLPVGLFLAGLFILLVRPVLDWLTVRAQDIGDDDAGKD